MRVLICQNLTVLFWFSLVVSTFAICGCKTLRHVFSQSAYHSQDKTMHALKHKQNTCTLVQNIFVYLVNVILLAKLEVSNLQ